MAKGKVKLAGAAPFGMGETKPHHFMEMAEIAWRNRGKWGYAWRVLNDGVCDGCALGTSGLRDWTIDGTPHGGGNDGSLRWPFVFCRLISPR